MNKTILPKICGAAEKHRPRLRLRKRPFLTSTLSCLLFTFLFLTLTSALTYAATIGKITAIAGDVDVLKPGMERAAPAALQQSMSEGDIIRTKSNAKAEITFLDESVIRLAPGSRLEITRYLMDGSERKSGIFNLFRGKMRAIVAGARKILGVAFREGNEFEVRTPTAVAGVKGTDFFVFYNMGVTGIVVTDGKVDVFNPAVPDQIIHVADGMATIITGDAPPSAPRPAADIEIIRHTRDTDPGEKPKGGEGASTAGGPPAGETFGYEAPEGGTAPPSADTGTAAKTVEIPSSESHPELLSDIIPPVIGIAGPPKYTNVSTAAFTVTFNEPANVTYTMGAWGATSTATTSDTFSIAALPEGTYTLTVTATDAAGNTSTSTYTWTTDYTAPVVSIVPAALPDAGVELTKIGISLSSSESSTYSYSLDGGAWTITAASFNLTGLTEGSHTLDYKATDAAGNAATNSLSFDLSRYSLTGNVGDASSTFTGSVTSGEVAGVSNQVWGGWSISMSGSLGGAPPSTFTMAAGGKSTDTLASNNGGYWLDVINGTSDGISALSGTSTLKYLSYDRYGTGTGAMTGSFGGGNWSAADSGAGTYTETPLAFSGNIGYDYNDNGLYTVDGTGITGIGDSYGGLLGGITSSLSNPATITYIGPYTDFGANSYPYIWTPVIYSGNGSSAYAPSYDGNEFWGYIGGRWQNRTIDGRVYSLYIDSSGNAGILKGSLSGGYYPELSMLEADGTWAPIQLSTGVSQTALTNLTYSPDWYWSSTTQTFSGGGYLTSGGVPLDTGIFVAQADGRKDSIAGQDWGIWQTILGGTYTTSGSPDGFILSTEVIDITSGKIAGANTDGTLWSNNQLAGTTYGYGADISATPMTWISIGETVGTFTQPPSHGRRCRQGRGWIQISSLQ